MLVSITVLVLKLLKLNPANVMVTGIQADGRAILQNLPPVQSNVFVIVEMGETILSKVAMSAAVTVAVGVTPLKIHEPTGISNSFVSSFPRASTALKVKVVVVLMFRLVIV